MINGVNSSMLSRITGRHVREESRATTTNYDILLHMRRMCLRWLGEILRSSQNNLTFKVIELQVLMNTPGNILEDAPTFTDMPDLVTEVMDRSFWKEHEKIFDTLNEFLRNSTNDTILIFVNVIGNSYVKKKGPNHYV